MRRRLRCRAKATAKQKPSPMRSQVQQQVLRTSQKILLRIEPLDVRVRAGERAEGEISVLLPRA